NCSSSTISTFMSGSFTVSRSILWGRGAGAEQRPTPCYVQEAQQEQECHRGDRDEVEGGGDSDRDGGRDRGGDERAGPTHEGLRHIEADRAAGLPSQPLDRLSAHATPGR